MRDSRYLWILKKRGSQKSAPHNKKPKEDFVALGPEDVN
jgi:hypothetical protein